MMRFKDGSRRAGGMLVQPSTQTTLLGDYCTFNFWEAEDELVAVGGNAMNEFELNETIAHVRIGENNKECMQGGLEDKGVEVKVLTDDMRSPVEVVTDSQEA